MGRTSIAFLLTMGLVTVPGAAAHAQVTAPDSSSESLNLPSQDTTGPAADVVSTLKVPAPSAFKELPAPADVPPSGPRRPLVLVPMYAGLVALQGYDTYSTLAAIRNGAVELNPLMRGTTGQPAVFVAFKGATTVASIYAAERLWRNHRKGAAIALMAVTNGMLAIVAANNASVLRSQR